MHVVAFLRCFRKTHEKTSSHTLGRVTFNEQEDYGSEELSMLNWKTRSVMTLQLTINQSTLPRTFVSKAANYLKNWEINMASYVVIASSWW